MKNGRIQAKDIDDASILKFLAGPEYEGWAVPGHACAFGREYPSSIYNALQDEVPPKVVMSKMQSMIRRGLVEGCTCGCRGDFKLTHEGYITADLAGE